MSELKQQLKRHYNTTLGRYYKAAPIMDDNSIPLEKRIKWVPNFRAIIQELNAIIKDFEQFDVSYTDDQILNGFELEEKILSA
jgi:hypothetical protein